jgi:flavin reductase (DIM6/NTAB) family NADH-FMN oxidoreductase RutF
LKKSVAASGGAHDRVGREEPPPSGYAGELVLATFLELDAGARNDVLDRARDEHFSGTGHRDDPGREVNRDAAEAVVGALDLAGVDAGPHLDAEPADGGHDRLISRPGAAGARRPPDTPGGTMLQPLQTTERDRDLDLVPDFLDALSRLASSVVLVTCWVDGRPWGMTVTAFCSVSATPPTVLVLLGEGTSAARAISGTGRFGVGILGETQEAAARHGSRPGAMKYLEDFVAPTATRNASPAVADALSHLDCEVIDTIPAADHVLFLGRVRAARSSGAETAPLLYQRRRFRRLAAG